jgi:hypothetical protein
MVTGASIGLTSRMSDMMGEGGVDRRGRGRGSYLLLFKGKASCLWSEEGDELSRDERVVSV